MKIRPVFIVFLIGLLLSSFVSAEDSKPVQTVKVERGTLAREWVFSGTVEARAEVHVAPEVPGRIVAVKVDKGDVVKVGDVLATLDTTKLELAVRQAEAALGVAKVNYEHTQQTAQELVMVRLRQAQAGAAAASTAVEQVKDLAYVRTTSQQAQAEAGLDALKATLRKVKEGARAQEIKQVEAMLEQAKAGQENARSNLERVRQLHEQDAASDQTLEGVQTQYKVAEAQYKAAQQQLDLVKEGARQEDIEAVEAQLRQAEAGMQLVEQLNTTKSWEKDIALAESQSQQAQAGLRAANIQVESQLWELQIAVAKSQMEQAEIGLELARQQLEDASISSSIDGVISGRMAEVGNMAAPGVPLFDLVDLSERRVSLQVSESDLPYLSVGQEVQVTLAGQNEPLIGSLDRISPTVDPDTRTGEVRVLLADADEQIRPGMYAEAHVRAESGADALLVPRSAVLGISRGNPYLFMTDGGKAVRCDVVLGIGSGAQIEILQGIREDADVIVSGHFSLTDGEAVHVVQP